MALAKSENAFAETPPSAAPATQDARSQTSPKADEPHRPTALYTTQISKPSTDEPRTQAEEDALVALASELDALLADAAQDLGLSLDLGRRARAPKDDIDLVALAESTGGRCIVPTLSTVGADVELRIALAEPDTKQVRSRLERTSREDIAVRAVVMLRDLVTSRRDPPDAKAAFFRANELPLSSPKPSSGRTSLAVHATLFGGVVGYSIQRASGSEDPRLLYPLLAVGAGGGLVSSILAAEEWDITVGDAWYLAAGAWWPTLASHLLFAGRFGDTSLGQERWTSGLVAGTMGLSIATIRLSIHGVSEGGALLTHSGASFGLVLGGVAQALWRGDVEHLPLSGMGYGAGLGWLLASSLATHVRLGSSRVVAVDLGALLGGLGGAALGSPLLFQHPTQGQQRLWAGVMGSSVLVGAVAGWMLSRPKPAAAKPIQSTMPSLPLPQVGVIGESVVGARRAPVVGISWGGLL